MRWRPSADRGPGEGGDAELDARLSRTWAAGTAAVGQLLDIPAGKAALLAAVAPARQRTARRGRHLAVGLAGGVAVVLAVVVAVALATAGVPGTRQHGAVIKTVDLVRRVDRALTAAEPGQLARMTVTSSGASGTIVSQEWSYGTRWRSVIDSPAGQPDYAEGFRSPATFTVVSYQARVWARTQIRAATARTLAPPGCHKAIAAFPLLLAPGLPRVGMAPGSLPTTVTRDLRAAISCGTLIVAGRQSVGGVSAIKLISAPGSLVAETIWVSPGSYLPVRVTARSVIGNHVLRQTADIRWLRPTAQNLASLTVQLPAGFGRVPLGPLLERASGRLAQQVSAAP
jgi:hypothetical protein